MEKTYRYENGIIVVTSPETRDQEKLKRVTEEFVKEFDILIFCLYPKVFIEWIDAYQSFIKPNALLTDVTGIKKYVVEIIS